MPLYVMRWMFKDATLKSMTDTPQDREPRSAGRRSPAARKCLGAGAYRPPAPDAAAAHHHPAATWGRRARPRR